MNWYMTVLQKYAEFNGRAHREEFWMFALINFAIMVGLAIFGGILHLGWVRHLYSLAILVPSLAVGARRLHDTNRSGWWQLIVLVPLIGIIVLVVFWAQDSDAGENRYDSSPKTA